MLIVFYYNDNKNNNNNNNNNLTIFENILDNIPSFINDNILHNDIIGIMCVYI